MTTLAVSTARARHFDRSVVVGLLVILLAGVALRAWLLQSPLGEVEADESVVGLMALHILQGEFPAFYWGQPYLGSLEAYLMAAAFALFGPSNVVLKAVPGCVYAIFVVLVFLTARRELGPHPALAAALYLVIPPSFLAFWSLKARGGYVELLALGQALLWITPWVTRAGSGLWRRVGLAGLLAGLLVWTHLLGLVYALPAAIFLLARLRTRLLWTPLLAGLVGLLLGAAPALVHNQANGWETLVSLSGGGTTSRMLRDNLEHLARVGLPVMLGLGQATTSPVLFAEDWPRRLGGQAWVPPLLLVVLSAGLLPALGAVVAAIRDRSAARRSDTLLAFGVLLLTPMFASLGPLGESIAEPRYALPLYATLPLFALALAWLATRSRLVAITAVGLVLALNLHSLLTADPRLNLPTTAAGSTAANRAELLRYLEGRGVTEIYADYWLAYPLMFESTERVLASVSSGGYNRFAPYAHLVSVSESPGFVVVRGSTEQADFETRLARAGGSAERAAVSIYEVFTSVRPLERLRP